MHSVYNVLIWLALPLIVLYHTYRSASRGRPAAFLPRFGFLPPGQLAVLAGRRPIWVHAVSVGETIAVKPLLSALKRRYPDRPLVLSNMTETGRSIALSLRDVDLAIYFPFDYPFAVRRLLTTLDPCLVVIVETELWPNFLRRARTAGIPAVIVNGRISDRSLRHYLKLGSFFRSVLGDLAACCMQSDEDARRMISMGAPPSRVHVTRNLKFDISTPLHSAAELATMRSRFRIPGDLFIFTAGSTHPGEEEAVLATYAALLATGLPVLLVLVPRHPERAQAVGELVTRGGRDVVLRSDLGAHGADLVPGSVLLVDTVGELMAIYAVSDLVFVGGSLVPLGGHNLLEPASLGKATLFGPHMNNFREIAAMALQYGAARQVTDASSLADASVELLRDEGQRAVMGGNGRRLLSEQGGATELNMAVIDRILQGD